MNPSSAAEARRRFLGHIQYLEDPIFCCKSCTFQLFNHSTVRGVACWNCNHFEDFSLEITLLFHVKKIYQKSFSKYIRNKNPFEIFVFCYHLEETNQLSTFFSLNFFFCSSLVGNRSRFRSDLLRLLFTHHGGHLHMEPMWRSDESEVPLGEEYAEPSVK